MMRRKKKKRHRGRRILIGLMSCVLIAGTCMTSAGAASSSRRILLSSVPSTLSELIRQLRGRTQSTMEETISAQEQAPQPVDPETDAVPETTVVLTPNEAAPGPTFDPSHATSGDSTSPFTEPTSIHQGSWADAASASETEKDINGVFDENEPVDGSVLSSSDRIPEAQVTVIASSEADHGIRDEGLDDAQAVTLVDETTQTKTESIVHEEPELTRLPIQDGQLSSAKVPGTGTAVTVTTETQPGFGWQDTPEGSWSFSGRDDDDSLRPLWSSALEELMAHLEADRIPVSDETEEGSRPNTPDSATTAMLLSDLRDTLGTIRTIPARSIETDRDGVDRLNLMYQELAKTAGQLEGTPQSGEDDAAAAQPSGSSTQTGSAVQSMLPVGTDRLIGHERMLSLIFKTNFEVMEAEESYTLDRHGNPVSASAAETGEEKPDGIEKPDDTAAQSSVSGSPILGFTLPAAEAPVTDSALLQWHAQMPKEPLETDGIEPWTVTPHDGARRVNGTFTFEARGYEIDLEEARASISRWVREAFGEEAQVQFGSESGQLTPPEPSIRPGVEAQVAGMSSASRATVKRTLRTGDKANVVQANGVTGTYDVIVRGDVTQSGAPGVTQLVNLVQATNEAHAAEMTEHQKAAADVNGDGKISLTDVTKQAQYMVSPHAEGALHPAEPVHQAWESDNLGAHNYINFNRWAAPTTSYLMKNADGGVSRVEYVGDTVVVENYGPDLQLKTSRQIPVELEKWGGFYAGKDYNYVVFGQQNKEEDPDREVVRIVQYTKDWKRSGSVSLYGANTQDPFLAGSLRCTEANGYLYVHSCHNMFKNKDGINHQANMMIAVDQKKLRITDTETGVVWGTGLVSHSFNQFVLVDKDGKLVVLDHGDGNTRTLALRRYLQPAGQDSFIVGDGQKMEVEAANVQKLIGEIGDNDTGCALGGFAETAGGYVSAYGYDGKGTRNDPRDIYFSFTDRSLNKTKTTRVTKGEDTQNPMLASLGERGGYLLWEDTAASASSQPLHFLKYSSAGSLGKQATADAHLSDCEPIEFNGRLLWYVTDKGAPTFYQLSDSGVTAVTEA